MAKLPGLLVLLAFGAAIVFYVVRSYRAMSGGGVAKHYGLAPGERVRFLWAGEVDIDISVARRVGTAAAGLVLGALFGGIGVATVRALGVTVLLTTHDRLVLVTEQHNGKVGRAYFSSPAEIQIQFAGPGPRRIQGGASVRAQLVGRDGIPCEAVLHHTAEPYLTHWLATGRAAAVA
jgi:hypothetical protein